MQDSAKYLLSDVNPLDSWMVEVCRISPDDRDYAHGFRSDIDINYKKYGYTDLDEDQRKQTPPEKKLHDLKRIRWKNEYTSREEVEQLISEIYKQKNRWVAAIAIISFIQIAIGIFISVWSKLH
jgi:hypothetical protein